MKFQYSSILHFWFKEISSKDWWVKNPDFDEKIKRRFTDYLLAAKAGELYHWREHAFGRLAEVIVLDQFSRNIFRDTPLAFAQDAQALSLTQELIRVKAFQQFNKDEKLFAFLPLMHSESKLIHESAVEIFTAEGLDLEFELKHKVIIDKFGRYPHRNEILGRVSSPAEIEFLKTPGSSF